MIHIFYRHAQINSPGRGRPSWFSYINCFKNLEWSINKHPNIKINIAYDGENNNNDVIQYAKKYPIFSTNYQSSLKSYRDLLNYIKGKKDIKQNDLIYFLENDYLHNRGWVDIIYNLFNTYDVSESYISLYDHMDKYIHPMYDNLVSKIYSTSKCHWRTTPSTCGSFIITKKLFDLDYDIWSTTIGDHNTFLYLNQTRSRFVLTPLPGLSTHCMGGLMSPSIDWEFLNNKSLENE